jgi:hypothetical protein
MADRLDNLAPAEPPGDLLMRATAAMVDLAERNGPEARAHMRTLLAALAFRSGGAATKRRATDAEVMEWVERHDLHITNVTDARCAFEDAETLLRPSGGAAPPADAAGEPIDVVMAAFKQAYGYKMNLAPDEREKWNTALRAAAAPPAAENALRQIMELGHDVGLDLVCHMAADQCAACIAEAALGIASPRAEDLRLYAAVKEAEAAVAAAPPAAPSGERAQAIADVRAGIIRAAGLRPALMNPDTMRHIAENVGPWAAHEQALRAASPPSQGSVEREESGE